MIATGRPARWLAPLEPLHDDHPYVLTSNGAVIFDLRTHSVLDASILPLEETLAELQRQAVRRVVLKPLLLVAGEHALRDLAGPGEDSWRSILQRQAVEVVPVLTGLGEEPAFARILVQHAADAATDAGLELC